MEKLEALIKSLKEAKEELNKAKFEQNAPVSLKLRIRANRENSNQDKLQNKENSTTVNSTDLIDTAKRGQITYRKPKSGEKPLRGSKKMTDKVRNALVPNYPDSVPDAGVSHMAHTGTSKVGLDSRKKMNKSDEPHKDDPKHEKKEQEKAKVIKDKAEEILDMHKDGMGAETMVMHKNGQWSLEKGDVVDMKTRKVTSSIPTDKLGGALANPKTRSVLHKPDLKSVKPGTQKESEPGLFDKVANVFRPKQK